MHDTKITPRQQFILGILEKSGNGLTRSAIEERLVQNRFRISRITVIRDLNQLIEKGILKTEGEGRAIQYLLVHQSPVLQYKDLSAYFEEGVDERTLVTNRNFTRLASQLTNLLSHEEQNELDQLNARYQANIKNLDPAVYQKELERFIIELSWKSSKIEGNTYSLLETEMLLNQAQEAQGHPREEAIMLLNHKAAFETIWRTKNHSQC